MSDQDDRDQAAAWVAEQKRIIAKRVEIGKKLRSDPAAISALRDDWASVVQWIALKHERESPPNNFKD